MKAENAITRLNKLNANKGTKAYQLILNALQKKENTIRPCWTSGHGRFCTNLDYTEQVANLLKKACIKFVQGNDAARGGKTGNYIILTHINF